MSAPAASRRPSTTARGTASGAGGPAVRSVPAAEARRLLMHGKGLLDDPDRDADPAALQAEVERLGFVQVDSIRTFERAHHHVLMTRFDGYAPDDLTHLLEEERSCFEHWTHDASIVPVRWFGWWRHRFARAVDRGAIPNAWWRKRLGPDPEAVCRSVVERLDRDGPLLTSDFDAAPPGHDPQDGRQGFWKWKPQKAALEFLWRTGRVLIDGRRDFEKRWDLAERVLPTHADPPGPPDPDELDDAARIAHVDWACTEAIDRLAIATSGELAAYLNAVAPADAKAWCARALAEGRVIPVRVEDAGGDASRPAVAVADLDDRLAALPDAPVRTRLLSPFDPVIRDRTRLERRFGFTYRFEAFVPAAKRRYGYYVLPVLEGDRLTGRCELRFDRKDETVIVRGPWWEPGVRATAARRRAFEEAVAVLAGQAGARWWMPEDEVDGRA